GLQITEKTQNSVTLSWNTAERAEVYDIEADGAIIDSTTEITYIHAGLAPDTEHSYRVRARNRGGISEWTAEAMIRTLPEKPSIPNNLTATAGTNEITLSWDAAERAEEYDIEADGTIIATITGTSYTHNGLTPDTMHTYRVKARNIGGESDYSTMITAYTLPETAGMALTNVAAVVTNTSITLMWDAVAADTEYEVEADGEIKDNGKSTTYIHGGLQPVTSHTYKIRPKKGEEKGPWCAVLAISTLPNAPGAPDNIRAIVTNTAIQLMWDPEEGATGYDIEIDGNHVESTADTVFTHKDLIPGTEHSYRIRATNIGGTAAWSEAIVKSTIKPTYMIEAEAGKEYHIALTAMGMQEFSGRKLVLEYDPGEAEIIDLCEGTGDIELESGKIPGTDITIIHAEGRIELKADKRLEPGKAWTGVINTILIRSRIDGVISLDYLVE
ncbi:MAG: fibronectin type III domain-containing protein, partial [Clostridiaceae bacterium]|nr:fibronectin type III domain-containing protein [Clostridiaceae bacterium]